MSLINLPWLPPAPSDFRARCKGLKTDEQVRFLAGHAMDLTQLNNLAKALGKVTAETLTPLRLGVLGNATTELLVPALIASAARHGMFLDVIATPFDQAMQAALDQASPINTGDPDVILLAFDHRIISAPADSSSEEEAAHAIDVALDHIDTICETVHGFCGATAIIQTLAPPPFSLLGSYDRRLPGSARSLIDVFNSRLIEKLQGSGNLLLDVAGLSSAVGLETWHDPTQWYLAKLSFSQVAVPLYADHVTRLLAALRGKSRKCLVMDLDNTLWGGIIGDDGLDGIVIGQGDPLGEAYLDIQRTAMALKKLGIVLAISSKNEDATARLPFREHPDMLLKEGDIAVFQANWKDKASNLEAIAAALDIGLDVLVLLDDNPAERAQVREALPEVGVPELPEDPAQYCATLLAAGYFETVSFSEEDRIRANDYTDRAKRVELQGETRDLNAFHKSLDMQICFSEFDATGRGRIAQLINKSNQFNLTTRRYTEHQVKDMEEDSSFFTLQVRLRDRFGCNGMISVIICKIAADVWDIDTWLMSCRVLGRRVEEAVLAEIAEHAITAGAKTLQGLYIPTDRNDLVSNHYKLLGFSEQGTEGSGQWILNLDTYSPLDLPMQIERVFAGDPS